ncbi:MAG: AraC family transcriptional regulator [Bacteroidota bacterium]|nr:AraC family transcriptional regulator [Bacteroidota bacterium]MDP4217238.1 AraC family transcriptional regulator [Bacteroidota bacterium]MDP4246007.1 AraC family transcriptional regulator [Bacteroidota bacterium]
MLQASIEVLQAPASGQSFLLKVFGAIAFTAPYHFHPEYELTLILGGRGKRYMGSHMADFGPGDLVLVGSNLAHCWKLETNADDGNPPRDDAGAIVIQFTDDFLGADFLNKAELAPIARLLQRSHCGIRFREATVERVGKRIRVLSVEADGFRRLLCLLEILQELAESTDDMYLDPQRVRGAEALADQERTHPVFAYLVENFRGSISLNKAAEIAGMTPNAFCRYFKKITRKTFMETVIEYRLNYATQQLIQTDKPVSSICFESGFGDISHFHKTFRSKMRLSPLSYRKKFMQGMNRKRGQAEHRALLEVGLDFREPWTG